MSEQHSRMVLLEAIVDLAHKSREKADAYCRRVLSESPMTPYLRPTGVWALIDAFEAFIRTIEALTELGNRRGEGTGQIVTGTSGISHHRACGAIRVVNAAQLLDRITLEL